MEINSLEAKKICLVENLQKYNSIAVAFSGGVDSSFLLSMANIVSNGNVLAITAASPVHPEREKNAASKFVKDLGIEHILFYSNELNNRNFTANPKDRCYICKKIIFNDIIKIANKRGVDVVAHGANYDDLRDYRPGLRAADEMGIEAPLLKAEFTKDEIRFLSKEMGLSTWNKPAMACLATRIPYGTPITEDTLKMVEKAEVVLEDFGFPGSRVRCHGKVARLEIDITNVKKMFALEMREKIIKKLKEFGFLHIAVDLEGYVQGSMNRAINPE